MQVHDGRLTVSATDLGRFLSCRHLTALDIEVALKLRENPPVLPDPFLELLLKRGDRHEKDYKTKVEASGSAVLDLGGLDPYDPLKWKRCLEAMKEGMAAIAQGEIGRAHV